MEQQSKMTIELLQAKKKEGRKITMLTAYDFPLAELVDRADLDLILVGDTVANVVLGLESTTEVGMDVMIHHAKAVRRAVKRALLVGDLPFEALQKDPQGAARDAERFVQEAGCDAVKMEWFNGCLETAKAIIAKGIPVMGHVGLTPQTAEKFKVQGKDKEAAGRILKQAKDLEAVGCFSLVLECIPSGLAKIVTEAVSVSTIGIGAGPFCDGQVLVTHDLLGLFERYRPKFVKRYVQLGEEILKGIQQFRQDVEDGRFPDAEHSYSMDSQQLEQLQKEKE